MRVAQAQLDTRTTQIRTLTEQKARLDLEVADARATLKALKAARKQAGKDAKASAAARAAAERTLTDTQAALSAARAEAETAGAALAVAQEALDAALSDERRAASKEKSAATKVLKAKGQSRRKALVQWQMAAVAAKAAHAREVIADERLADLQVGTQAAESVLSEAEAASSSASSAHKQATRVAQEDADRVVALKADLAATTTEVEELTAELASTSKELTAAEKASRQLTTDLESLQKQVSALQSNLTAAELTALAAVGDGSTTNVDPAATQAASVGGAGASTGVLVLGVAALLAAGTAAVAWRHHHQIAAVAEAHPARRRTGTEDGGLV